jgi:hypothetical protein
VLTGKNNRQFFAHRIAYERAKGPIPAGLYVCHTCDNPPCCNPAHLFVGSSRDNTRDMIQKGRSRVIGAHGETNPAHKLTENDVRMIRALYPRLSQVAIARRFRINQTIVSDIVRREIWKHVA